MGLDPSGGFILRDDATGQTFTGGSHPTTHALYLNKIALIRGAPLAQREPQLYVPTPTPIVVSILVEGVRNPDLDILVRPGDVISKGQLIADMLPQGTPAPNSARPQAASELDAALAQAELDLAKAEYSKALEGTSASESAILQADASIAQIEASIAALQQLQVTRPDLPYVPQQINAAQSRLAAAQSRLAEIRQGRGPSYGDVAVAKAHLQLAELRYQQAIATPLPTPTPAAPNRIVSLVTGHVLSVQIVRVVGNLATVEIRVTP